MEEIWKKIPDNEDYEVSNMGRVRHITYLKPAPNSNGYLRVGNCGNMTMRTVHRLVATLFVPNPENKAQINHINGNKRDNRAENLEWVTQSENIRHGYALGLYKGAGGKGGWVKVAKCDPKTDEVIEVYESISEAARQVGVGNSTISGAIKGNLKTAKGFKWKKYDV